MNITSILFPEHQHCVVRTREAFDNASDGMGLAPHDVCDQQRSKLTILVILHYLLKNNITFMGGILQGKSGGGLQPPVTCLTHGAFSHDWRIV